MLDQTQQGGPAGPASCDRPWPLPETSSSDGWADGAIPPGTPAPGRVEDFEGAGGVRQRYRVVAAREPRHVALYLHGIESHGAWFLPAAWGLRERGCTTYLLDRRGSGLNRREHPGDAPGADCLLEDVRRFRSAVGDPDVHVVGLSWGGKLAIAAALDRPQRTRSLVLVTPGLRARLDLSLAAKLSLLAGLLAGGRNRVNLPIDTTMFTTTPRWLDFIRGDPWRLERVTGRLLLAGRSFDRMIARRITELRVPVLLFLAGRDRIIDNRGVLGILGRLGPGQVRVRRFEDADHLVQLEHTAPLVETMAAFFEATVAPC